ncbi:bifunctional 3-(3-hydroxy-phenyl)propionate/3-hydroxycinnamic acid hydroxylase [Klenkia taihuensis]|uniref:3-(3-hydroxy-phenyl)propionate hydroxylase n=1 Tax=Klenkia taihuensis TaxID=1225127 RepID=A0A1I1UAC4_9ACTN|nr:bifunctional 3-(3-hydroxy-phenyl)propionate/3-hydroxycinnamic acid hydroxylase [Klenkia taihuensis]GHE06939.1 3-(3-hydroxyphenyl)propionate hydroxylase [Klenkia taihuensis]SFD65713.1 3-(3-hydroxy-phenyl)propionate hydroxylase [Klenkia taihuensis]
MTVDVDVAIVGYGPGGEVLASLLGQAGHRVVVFEKFPAPYGLPRMSTLDGEIARLLQHTGDGVKALEGSVPQHFGNLYGADGELAIRFDWTGELCGHASHLSLHQPNIESAMQERVASLPSVDVRWGTEVTEVEDLGDSVRVTARTLTTTDEQAPLEQVTATYVVGMDGASSFVRQALGIPLEILRQHDDQWFLTDFDILDPAIKEPETEIHMIPTGPYFWGPNGAGRCRTDVRIMPGTEPAELMDEEHGYAWLEANIGIPREAVRISRRVLYRFRSQYAKSFRSGRVFIGGDAAHAMTPFMAQGSCSAMRDGANLAWKLDLVLRGCATDELLDTYEPERLAHVVPLVHGSLAQWGLLTEEDSAKAAGRDAFLRSGEAHLPPMPILTAGIIHRGPDGEPVGPAGELSPQGKVRIGEREGLLDDLVGFGFQVISADPLDDALTDAQRSALDSIGAKVLILGDGGVGDLEDTYATFLAEHGATSYISRPDFYLFGTATGPQATSALVDALLAQLPLTAQPVPA